MTDNDIIKAFEEQINLIGSMKGVYLDGDGGRALYDAMDDARILINRQKAEIERLETNLEEAHIDIKEHLAEIEALKLINSTYVATTNEIREIAIKEFAENLKLALLGWDSDAKDEDIEWEIDNLVKEMVGERE